MLLACTIRCLERFGVSPTSLQTTWEKSDEFELYPFLLDINVTSMFTRGVTSYNVVSYASPKVNVPFSTSSYPFRGYDPTIVSSALRAVEWYYSPLRKINIDTGTYGSSGHGAARGQGH